MQKGADDIEVERKKYKALDAIEEYREAAGVDPLAAADNVRRSAGLFLLFSRFLFLHGINYFYFS